MDECDARAIVRLLGDPRLFRRDSESRKRLLLANLCRLIGGDAWSYSLHPRDRTTDGEGAIGLPGGPIGGLGACAPAAPREKAKPKDFYVDASLIVDGAVSRIRLSRGSGRRPFSLRERKIAQIVLTETVWLHESVPSSSPAHEPLTPRQQATLICAVEGLSRLEIAERLQISRHTVDDYMKTIYRRYRVNSRAMLIKRLALLDGEGSAL